MIYGIPLTDSVKNILYDNAIKIINSEKKFMKIVHDDVDGFIETEFNSVAIGALSGVEFTAEICTSKGSTTVSFFAKDKFNEKASWYSIKKPDNSYKWN